MLKNLKIIAFAIALLFLLGLGTSVEATNNLIKNPELVYNADDGSNTKLTISLSLSETLDLSQENSNVIIEYFIKSDNSLITIHNKANTSVYSKDKTWSGYLNSYDSGSYKTAGTEIKYSKAGGSNAYLDIIPANMEISTQLKPTSTYEAWETTTVFAVKLTVLRTDGSGEKVILYSDGTAPVTQKIEVPVSNKDTNSNIKLEATTGELPSDTALVVNKMTNGNMHNIVTVALQDIVNNFITYDITLVSNGQEQQPNGKVKISIPIPDNFDTSNLVVYRILEDGTKIEYAVTVVTLDGIKYATFETDHFSTYVLAEVAEVAQIAQTNSRNNAPLENDITENDNNDSNPEKNNLIKKDNNNNNLEKDDTPKTGTIDIIYYLIPLTIIAGIGIVAFRKKQK